MKHWMVQIEGIDKTGKDLLVKYLQEMSNYKYTPYARGIISLLSYNERYERNEDYDLESIITKNWIFIYLYGDEEDIKIRCKVNNEDYRSSDIPFFKSTINKFEKLGYKILKYNVSKLTYYEISKKIIKYLEDLENGKIS